MRKELIILFVIFTLGLSLFLAGITPITKAYYKYYNADKNKSAYKGHITRQKNEHRLEVISGVFLIGGAIYLNRAGTHH